MSIQTIQKIFKLSNILVDKEFSRSLFHSGEKTPT